MGGGFFTGWVFWGWLFHFFNKFRSRYYRMRATYSGKTAAYLLDDGGLSRFGFAPQSS
jgi:hypothetical protein